MGTPPGPNRGVPLPDQDGGSPGQEWMGVPLLARIGWGYPRGRKSRGVLDTWQYASYVHTGLSCLYFDFQGTLAK